MLRTAWNNTKTVVAFLGLVAVVAVLAGGLARDRGQRTRAYAAPVAALIPPPTKDTGPEVADAFAAVAQRITSGVVRIETEKLPTANHRWLPRPLQGLVPNTDSSSAAPEMAGGSGFIVSPEGYILTNNHVVEGADIITVTLYDKRSYTAKVIGEDPTTDVALIKIDAPGLKHLPLGDSDNARVGEWVLAIGNPGFEDASTLDFTVTGGIISAKGRPLNVLNAQSDGAPAGSNFAIEDFIQTDAAINPGNSGGPLVNIRGEVIAINTAIASSTGYNEGYAFAVPINLARRVMSDLLEYGRVRRPLLGISIKDVTQEDAEVYGLPEIAGVLVEDFAEGSVAQHAGLERGDVIIAVDAQKVERVGQLQRLIAQHNPGEDVGLRVVRYGQMRAFRIRLQEAPIPEAPVAQKSSARPTGAGRLGIQVSELTDEINQKYGFERAGGAVITAVADYGAADRKQIEDGMRIVEINRRPIASAHEAQEELRRLRSGHIVSLVLEDPQGSKIIANVRIP
ncbi:MAG TPA: trypsin-like peptidase domain-containing protein [Longimicrobiales bacterium]|nr:trypsin-like peptidase domain-containing protein [Longimicrobiales bacterium]